LRSREVDAVNTHAQAVEAAASYLRERIDGRAEAAVVLGSGLAGVEEGFEIRGRIPYAAIPGFPAGVVKGHRGELLLAGSGGSRAILFSGRFHLYQGFSPGDVTLPIRVARRVGVRVLIVTNASGGIRGDLGPGDLMLITDHINLLGSNPLTGVDAAEFGDPFVDMTEPYSARLIAVARKVAADRPEIGRLAEGVYLATAGPSYETKAEIAFFSRIGAHAVGMSTVPEVIVAAHEGIEVLGVSVIANRAAGLSGGKLSHGDVLAAMKKASSRLAALCAGVLALTGTE
jgi:purine-nucleoside phosphorylase